MVLQWNDLTKQPEIIEAVKRVEERKEQEVEAKREEQARQDRYQGVLDRFISEGNVSLGGSNGCADQLTNWDGTQKLGLGAPPKKKSQGLSR